MLFLYLNENPVFQGSIKGLHPLKEASFVFKCTSVEAAYEGLFIR